MLWTSRQCITIKMQELQELYDIISSHRTKQLDVIFIVAGHFNKIDLKTVT